jgi:CRISPR-associated endonuclease Cas3-HD
MAVQSNADHQQGVAERAESFAAEFGMGDYGKLMGRLHDKGKEQVEWQKYIQGVTGYSKEYSHIKSRPNHSYVGAVIVQKQYPQIAPLIAQPIAGHHRGLYDYCDYVEDLEIVTPLVTQLTRTNIGLAGCYLGDGRLFVGSSKLFEYAKNMGRVCEGYGSSVHGRTKWGYLFDYCNVFEGKA